MCEKVIKTIVTTQGVDIPQGFTSFVTDKCLVLAKTAPDGQGTVRVTLKERRNPSRGIENAFKVTMRFTADGVDETVHGEGRTPNAAVDKTIRVLQRQIRQAKEKRLEFENMKLEDWIVDSPSAQANYHKQSQGIMFEC